MTRKPSEQVDFREVGRRVFQLVNISYPTLKDFLERSGINRAMLYRMRNDGNPLRVQDLVDIMMDYGAVNACNLDGGSSTLMWYDGAYVNNCASVIGIRPVPTAILVLKEGDGNG